MNPRALVLVAWIGGCDTPTAVPNEGPPAPAAPSPASPTTAGAQAPVLEPLGIGRAATADEIAAWDVDVDPSGRGLPPGSGTVARGAEVYAMQCLACHGAKGEGGLGPQLIGTEPRTGLSDDPKLPHTIGNWWPYPTTIFDYINRAMPQNAPNSLPAEDVYALSAFLLARNGAVDEDFVADAGTLPEVVMPTKVEFVRDDRPATAEFR